MDDLPKFHVDEIDNDPDDPCSDGRTIVDLHSRFETKLNFIPVELRTPAHPVPKLAQGSERMASWVAARRAIRASVLDHGFLVTFNDMSWGLPHDAESEHLTALDLLIHETVTKDGFFDLLPLEF